MDVARPRRPDVADFRRSRRRRGSARRLAAAAAGVVPRGGRAAAPARASAARASSAPRAWAFELDDDEGDGTGATFGIDRGVLSRVRRVRPWLRRTPVPSGFPGSWGAPAHLPICESD